MQVGDRLSASDFLISLDSFAYERIWAEWAWLVQDELSPIALTRFGDWFLKDPQGRVHFLDSIFGELKDIAESEVNLWKDLETQEKYDECLMVNLVLQLEDKGLNLKRGQCYGFTIHPIIGGPIDIENVEVMDIGVWEIICSSLNEQVRKMPPGARIHRVKVDKEGKLKLLYK